MDGRRTKYTPLACRYVPYDQWFLTHVDPTWKIKHIKQLILSKCFSLPLDPRRLGSGPRVGVGSSAFGSSSGVGIGAAAGAGAGPGGAGGGGMVWGGGEGKDDDRPPSPITFAPDEGRRPISPIMFASPMELRKKRSVPVSAYTPNAHTNVAVGASETAGTSTRDDDAQSHTTSTTTTEDAADDPSEEPNQTGYEEDDEWDEEEELDDDEEMDELDDVFAPPPVSSAVIPGGKVGFRSGSASGSGSGAAGGLPAASGRIGAFASSSSTSTTTHISAGFDTLNTNTNTKRKRRFNPLSKIGGGTKTRQKSTITSHPSSHAGGTRGEDDDDDIQTSWFTLLRFATGQILEDEFTLSWYDLSPHELVEMHMSVPPVNFAVSKALEALLLSVRPGGVTLATSSAGGLGLGLGGGILDGGGSGSRPHHGHGHSLSHGSGALIVKSGVITTSADAASALASALLIPSSHNPSTTLTALGLSTHTHNHKDTHNPPHSPLTPLSQHHHLLSIQNSLITRVPLTLTSLPRAEPGVYVKPYWEGWVRALRTVFRPELDVYGATEYGMGGFIGGQGGGVYGGGGTGGGGRGDRDREKEKEKEREREREQERERERERDRGGGGLAAWEAAFGGVEGMLAAGERIRKAAEREKEAAKRDRERGGELIYVGGGGTSGAAISGGRDRDRERERERERERTKPRQKTTLEWRERWVVIKDDVVHLYKERGDLTPTHRMPLGALINLRGAEHLAHSVHSKPAYPSSTHHHRTAGRPRSRGPTTAHRQQTEHRRSASQPRAGTSGPAVADTGRKEPSGSGSMAASGSVKGKTRDDGGHMPPVPRGGGGGNEMTDRALALARPPGLSSFDRKSEGSGRQHHQSQQGHSKPLTEAEVQATKEREAQRTKEKERERERRRHREKQERELESLRRWDDIGVSLSFPSFGGKSKDKGKGKEKEKEKERERERDKESRDKERGRDREREREREEKGKERERDERRRPDEERERAREADKDKAKRKRDADRSHAHAHSSDPRSRHNDPTYIPTSRDEADAAGMKIICAKFQSTEAWERQEKEKRRALKIKNGLADPAPKKYTSTGPSLAGMPVVVGQVVVDDALDDSAAGGKKAGGTTDDHGQGFGFEYPGQIQGFPPRKTSLPGLQVAGKLGPASSSLSIGTAMGTVTTSSLGRADSLAAMGNSKFGIGGLFGKDKEQVEDAVRREKEERKREEKEKKAKEKEQKQLEKERKKAKRKDDDDDDDFGVGSALSWKGGKKTTRGAPAVPQEVPIPVQTKDLQSVMSLATADSKTLYDHDTEHDEANMSGMVTATGRPKLTLSPNATPKRGDGSDSDSSLSMSSPVFAHSTDSEGSYDEDDLYGYGRHRQGYRYGGYHPSPAKFGGQKTIKGSQQGVETDGNRSEATTHAPSRLAIKTVTDTEVDRATTTERRSERQNEAGPSNQRSSQKEKSRPKHDRGEWLVLDMGSDPAFHSILRVLHRHFSNPLTSNFLPPSIKTGPPDGYPQVPIPGSPMQRAFWSASSSVLGNTTHESATANEVNSELAVTTPPRTTSLAPTDASSSRPMSAFDAGHDTEESSMQLAIQRSRQEDGHPQILTNLATKPPLQNTKLAPALPYPEWRTEVVHRARRYGMREAGRPLELALYAWGSDFVEMETSATYLKLRKKEEASRQRVRESISSLTGNIKPPTSSQFRADLTPVDIKQGMESSEGAASETETENEVKDVVSEENWETSESKRRMSVVSHVSTIRAPPSSSSISSKTITVQSNDDLSRDEDTQSDTKQTETDVEDSDTNEVETVEDGLFEGSYAYGLDDEESALAEGLGSIMADSDEESEVEWVAWTTDLPRQHMLREQQMELDRIAKQKAREEEELESESQPLSPMEFSNPFSGETGSFISQSVTLPAVLPPIPPPKTPEEERRQYAEKRRKLEPSAISTSMPPPLPPLPPLPTSPRVPGSNNISHQATPSTSSVQSNLHGRAPSNNVGQGFYHAQRYSTHSSTLSSPSSSESLGRTRQTPARIATSSIPVGLNNPASRNSSNPVSPLGAAFSPIDDSEEFERSYTTYSPPSEFGYTQVHRRTHSRSVSSSGPENDELLDSSHLRPRQLTLHHSTSMPLNTSSVATSSGPRSPVRISTAKTLAQPVSMPILTQAQISQIESEMEERMGQNKQMRHLDGEVASLLPSPSVSPPSYGFIQPRENPNVNTMPRRSSSAGTTVPTSPPPNSGVAPPIGRSTSVALPKSPQSVEKPPERGLLRKKRSDLGKSVSGNELTKGGEVNSPGAKQRPSLSLMGLSGNSSNAGSQYPEVQSPTQQRHPMGPRSAHPQVHDPSHATTPPPASSGSYQNAKALLRRVRSGSSLGMDVNIQEVSPHSEYAHTGWPHTSQPASGVIITSEVVSNSVASTSRPRDASPPAKKKIGTMDRIVRKLDSALEFVDGK